MPRTADWLPTDDDLIGEIRHRGCLTLRALCGKLWPGLRWRPLFPGEDSLAEGAGPEGTTRALWIWGGLGRLMSAGCIQMAGHDPDEVDAMAAATFELVGGVWD